MQEILEADAFAGIWESIRKGKRNGVALDHVAQPAWPFAAAAIVRCVAPRRVWIICEDARVQEQMYAEMPVWGAPGLFFPRLMHAGGDALPDPETASERISVLSKFSSASSTEASSILLICRDSLEESVPAQKELDSKSRDLKVGDELDAEKLIAELGSLGYERVPVVSERGQFARRGAIMDIYPWQGEEPLRLEWFDQSIESLRIIDVHSQMSARRIDSARLLLPELETGGSEVPLKSFLRKDDLVVFIESEEGATVLAGSVRITAGAAGHGVEDYTTAFFENPLGVFGAGDFVLHEARRMEFINQVEAWRRDGWRMVMFFHNEGERQRFAELVSEDWLDEVSVERSLGFIHRGFTVPGAKTAVLAGAEIFGRHQHVRRVRGSKLDEAQILRQAREHLRELQAGDQVVHLDYGIGRYEGIVTRDDDSKQEVMVIRYAEGAKAFVPLSQTHLVSRYVGAGGRGPNLNKLGDARWGKTRQMAEKSIEQFAGSMLSIAAQRQSLKGYAHEPDSKWQVEFEQSFLYRETPDQLRAVEEVRRDMENEKPMDRLLCGDVGFGKTEVAIRAAFKSVMSGRQVAILVPTTVLAQQHWQTLRERMSDYPVRVEMLSRLTPPKRVKQIVKDLAEGTVDIVVGTHRVISKDIRFKQLGLVVIDEEQRFGVKHKERFKELFRLVDVLTLSATPIPRTLYMALLGVRDMSTLDTPPANRIPVQTTVAGYDERLIRDAIDLEMERGGQVFLLHNRVMTIEKMRDKIQALCPKARILIGHGQMEAEELEEVMQTFVNGDADVLVCTTIIESGVDIPNANTIIIDRADRFGLADLYQLRGRVGRGGGRAHALLMLPRDMMTGGDARKRVNAIKQYTALGSGFKIAMRDLEIRGAGNLLGTEQSGHITAIGFDLYCQLLKAASARLQGRRTAQPMEVSLHVDFLCLSEAQWLREAEAPAGRRVTAATAHRPPDKQKTVPEKSRSIPAFIPASYMEDAKSRITAYRQVAETMTRKELDYLERDWRDQFGPMPPAAENLLVCAGIRLVAAHLGISAVEIKESKLMLTRKGRYVLLDGKFPRLTALDEGLQLREALQLLKNF